MTANPHLKPILDAYIAQETPGYAILVNAPWGAGKTYAVKEWLKGKKHLYVSLFGADSASAIEEAIFQAALYRDGGDASGKLAIGFSKVVDPVLKLVNSALGKATNFSVDLSSVYRKLVISKAPDLLIFDDLERAQLPPAQLLAALNRFVEHEGKKVILIANEKELKKSDDYDRWREKVVGRTVTLEPETEAGLISILAALPAGQGRKILIAKKDLIREVFDLCKIPNLRLLRQSCDELARFLVRLPPFFRDQDLVIPGLIGDYLALSISWHAGGNLIEDDFHVDVTDWSRFSAKNNGEEIEPTRLERMQAKFSDFPSVLLDGQSLPGPLAHSLIVRGHASDEEIQAQMETAIAFKQKDTTHWLTLWQWKKKEDVEIEEALRNVESDLVDLKIVSPEVFLHVFSIFLDFAEHGLFAKTETNVIASAQAYLDRLMTAVPPILPATGVQFDSHELTTGSFNFGYHMRETEAFQNVRKLLVDALIQTQQTTRGDRLKALIADLEHAPDRYWMALHKGDLKRNIPFLYDELIFLGGDPSDIARQVFSLSPDRWSHFLSPMKDRIERQVFLQGHRNDGRQTEVQWLRDFRAATVLLSDSTSLVKKQQIVWVLKGQLDFLDTIVEPPIPNNPLIPPT